MKNRFQIPIGVVLAALIALTSVSMSLARGQMRDASGTMILCTGTGPMSVVTDSNGEPIGPMPICPDCAFSFLEILALVSEPADLARTNRQVFFAAEMAQWDGREPTIAKARGPPVAA